jgi:hypothetical protein
MAAEVVITSVRERHACLFVEGVCQTPRGWRKAAFTVSKADVLRMNKREFDEFAKRNLPHVTEDEQWDTAR